MIRIHNSETNEILDRELTEDEISQNAFRDATFEELEQIKAEKQVSKAALLERLGITEEEAKLLLS